MALVKRLLAEVVMQHPKVLKYPAPEVLFCGFGNSSLDWEVRFMVPNPRDRFELANDVLLQIDQAFREHGVQIPFPQRDLHLKSVDAAVAFPLHKDLKD
jgi:potassium efflux system protein